MHILNFNYFFRVSIPKHNPTGTKRTLDCLTAVEKKNASVLQNTAAIICAPPGRWQFASLHDVRERVKWKIIARSSCLSSGKIIRLYWSNLSECQQKIHSDCVAIVTFWQYAWTQRWKKMASSHAVINFSELAPNSFRFNKSLIKHDYGSRWLILSNEAGNRSPPPPR